MGNDYPDEHAQRGELEAFLRVRWAEVRAYGAAEVRELMQRITFVTTERSVYACISRLRKLAAGNGGKLPPPGPVVAELLAAMPKPKKSLPRAGPGKELSAEPEKVAAPVVTAPVPAVSASAPFVDVSDLAKRVSELVLLGIKSTPETKHSEIDVAALASSKDVAEILRRLAALSEQAAKAQGRQLPPLKSTKLPAMGDVEKPDPEVAAVIATDILRKVRQLPDERLRPLVMGHFTALLARTQASSRDFVEVFEMVFEGLLDEIHRLKQEIAAFERRRERNTAPAPAPAPLRA